ncbi:MAG: glycosyltransferase family 4 protein [Candidatus Methylomirabilis oxygeniifera]|uniref:Putative glycosyltransferase, group 1 n=1 Tax=Methylomirabilis oxygeniifera TaxID=671143 RepID=D5MLZ9_METO1|nr:MAG: glycosyltransferase family 4 protein [Candidatus Methylomirabilis oxyfera]CBE70056.1 putative glycosyltransferase, group 1 [Candidatus Methylomirabilis oxyfera]
MRVMYWSEKFWPYIGGVEVIATRLVQAFRTRGHEVIVVTAHDGLSLPDEDHYKGIPVFRFPFFEALAPSGLRQLIEVRQRVASLKQHFKPDVIHINFSGPTVFFHLATATTYSAPVLLTKHASFPIHVTGRDTLVEQALRNADWVTANSAAVLAESRRQVPEIIPRSSLIYNAMDVPAVSPEPLPHGAPRLLCLGRLSEEKGFDLALEAFALLRDAFPRARLIIAGNGPARPALERQTAELGLAESVDFIGWVAPHKVPGLMNTTTVVVMPSRREGFGLVALEAALMARPIVATRVGGLPEVVAHNETGLLVEPDDSKALAEAISALIIDRNMAAQMGQAGRRWARKMFCWERCVDAYAALYGELTREAIHVDVAKSLSPQ